MRVGRCDEARILGSVGRRRKAGGRVRDRDSGPTEGTGEWGEEGEEGEAEGDPPSPPAPSRVWRGSDRALTDGHVVAAVREAGVPVTELGLVAGAGALGLTGHWVGHGCGGRGRGSAGSPAAPPWPWHLCRPSLCRAVRARPPGRPRRGHHCVFPVPAATFRASPPHSVPGVAASCMSGSAGRGGWGASCRSRGGWRHMWAGPRRATASSTSGLGVLGSRVSGLLGCKQAPSVFEARVPRGRKWPCSRDWKVWGSIQRSHLCLSRCRASQTASCWP